MTTTVRRRLPAEPIHKKPLPKSRQASQRAVERLAQRNGNGKPVTDGVAFSEEYTVTYVAIDQLHRHPKNRTASDAFVAELAESIREHGLQQPIKVRVAPEHWGLPAGHYQIVFGESRWRAARLAGLETMPAHVVEFDDVKTLELIVVENAAREQLNPIQKAEQIEALCAPVEAGGGGKSREQAAQLLNLKTGAAASNLARLLELPKVWRQRVAGGELPESFARLLLPYRHVPELMEAFDKDYVQEKKHPSPFPEDARWSHREILADLLDDIAKEESRSVDRKAKVYYGFSELGNNTALHGRYGCLIDLDDATREKLRVFAVPISDGFGSRKRTKDEERAFNVALFDKLQSEAIKARHKDGGAKSKSKTKATKAAKPRKPTAAELKRQKEEAVRRLKSAVHDWRIRWLRWSLAAVLDGRCEDGQHWHVHKLLLRLFVGDFACLFRSHRDAADSAARKLCGVGRNVWALDETQTHALACETMKALLWPPKGLDRRDQRNLPEELIESLAREVELDEARLWEDMQAEAAVGVDSEWSRLAGEMFASFFQLHTIEQLQDLAKELRVPTAGRGGKAALVEAFTDADKLLPMPKSLKAAAPRASKARRKK